MQICFSPIINSTGGVEKVYCNMSNYFCKEHEIIDVCCDGIAGKPYYDLDESVKFININDGKKIAIPFNVKLQNEFARLIKKIGIKIEFSRERYIRKQINDKLKMYLDNVSPNVVICYELRSMVAVAECGYDLKKVVVMFHANAVNILNSLSNVQENILKQVKYVQVLMKSDEEYLLQCGYKNVVHIGNVVPQYDIDENIEKDKIIIHVGRLDGAPKRQHLLIEAFALIADRYPDWKVEFWGGDARPKDYEDKLLNLIKKYGLETKVFLMGKTNDIPSKLIKASIFAFPSAYEGFGLGLAEAMSTGLPVIGFRSCPAVNELIVDGENGILCEDGIENLSKAIEKLIVDEKLRNTYGMQARKDMLNYSADIIYNKWESMFEKL